MVQIMRPPMHGARSDKTKGCIYIQEEKEKEAH
jgi:hypothetical protein